MDILPKVKEIHWDIEVVIASSKGKEKPMKPIVKLQFVFENGQCHLTEMSMEQFAKFRLKTAEAMKISNDISKNKVLNIH